MCRGAEGYKSCPANLADLIFDFVASAGKMSLALAGFQQYGV